MVLGLFLGSKMISTLEKHHIGIAISKEAMPYLEKKFNKHFHFDEIQGVHVLFVQDEDLGFYKEFITIEGRAKNYNNGMHHICFNVPNKQTFHEIQQYIKDNKLGFRLTFPEKSGSIECNFICFYSHRDLGIIEFNILDYND